MTRLRRRRPDAARLRTAMTMIAAIAATTTAIGTTAASAGTAARTVFDCRTAKGHALVTATGQTVVYRFRGRDGRGIVTRATQATGNARKYSDLYASVERQIRFIAGPWSYTVYSMDADRVKGSSAVSGVMVRRGRSVVDDLACRPHAVWRPAPAADALPEDDKSWTAM